MKSILLIACASLVVLFTGYYFVLRPIQESNARQYCNAQGKKAIDGLFGYHTDGEKSDTYGLAYRTCLNQHGF